MQTKFIDDIESQGKEFIATKQEKVEEQLKLVDLYHKEVTLAEEKVQKHLKEQEKVSGATEKLRKFSGLKGKITQKAATLTKEHKILHRKYGLSHLYTVD